MTDFPIMFVHRSRNPVTTSDIVEHSPTNPNSGIGFKARAFTSIIIFLCLKQTNHASLNEVFDQNTGRKTTNQMMSDTLNQYVSALFTERFPYCF
ncbi:Uncharacterised protein [Vibrio cholerae]|nr:Uncharacterised protein [Vibrio cholerae]